MFQTTTFLHLTFARGGTTNQISYPWYFADIFFLSSFTTLGSRPAGDFQQLFQQLFQVDAPTGLLCFHGV